MGEGNLVKFKIIRFSEINNLIEKHLAVWFERAVEICGSKKAGAKIFKSLVNKDKFTEMVIFWI